MPTFEIADDFLLDGAPFRILSGAIHYFRIHPDQWRDRIRKARQLGLNTIETYVAWNAHSTRRGEFRTDGGVDLGRFLDEVHAEGMRAIVRPGPYICAEWHNGGLPAWLTATPGIRLRESDPVYLAAIEEYYAALMPILAPRQIDRGGPIILVQVENEYGAYGSDAAYLRTLVDLTRAGGITVPLTTVDQADDTMLTNGTLPGVHATASFGSRAVERLQTLRRHQPTGPLMCSEYWVGWFDHWGGPHHVNPAADSAADLDALLSTGASVNIYMFIGGTNFGFTSGANYHDALQPTVTSYDYDALLSEDGQPTEKYWAFREVLGRYTELPDDVPAPAGPAPAFEVALHRVGPLVQPGPDRPEHEHPPTMDALGLPGGLVRYSTVAPASGRLDLGEVRDRAIVLLDGVRVAVVERDAPGSCEVREGARIDVLVEDLGRVNYGPRIGEAKGLLGPVTLDGAAVQGWSAAAIELDSVPLRSLNGAATLDAPVLAGGEFELAEPADLFLDTTGFGKGMAWVNGANLGRFWQRGPTQTLYVPGPLLREGRNELVVLELDGATPSTARFVPEPRLGRPGAKADDS